MVKDMEETESAHSGIKKKIHKHLKLHKLKHVLKPVSLYWA